MRSVDVVNPSGFDVRVAWRGFHSSTCHIAIVPGDAGKLDLSPSIIPVTTLP